LFTHIFLFYACFKRALLYIVPTFYLVTFSSHKANKTKKRFIPMGQAFRCSDSDWARTNDLYPVKVALSQLSYGIILIGTNINISNCIYKVKLTMTISTLN